MTDPDLQSMVEDLHDHLEATAERPVETTASRWLGEAEAVAADAVGAPEAVVEKRVGQVRHLLSNVEDTGDEAADRHVEAARELLDAIDDRL